MTSEMNVNVDQSLRLGEADRWWDLYKGAATFAKEYGIATVRALVLINGGAAVALLAALSHVISINDEVAKKLAAGLVCPFGFFIGALVLAVATGAMGYLNFFFFGAGLPGPNELHRYLRSGDVSGWKPKKIAVSITVVSALLLGTLSLIGFGIGAISALVAFRNL